MFRVSDGGGVGSLGVFEVVGSLVNPVEFVPQAWYFCPLLFNLTYSSCNFANLKAMVKSFGLSMVTVILISYLKLLKNVLTFNSSLSPWILLDIISNWVRKSSTVEVCFSLVKVPTWSQRLKGQIEVWGHSQSPPIFLHTPNPLNNCTIWELSFPCGKGTFYGSGVQL